MKATILITENDKATFKGDKHATGLIIPIEIWGNDGIFDDRLSPEERGKRLQILFDEARKVLNRKIKERGGGI